MTAIWYLTVRLCLWCVAVIVALLPALFEYFQGSYLDNQQFRDGLFVVIPTSALGLSAILNYLCMGFKLISGTALALSVLGIIFNMLVLAAGIIGFLVIPRNIIPVPANTFWIVSSLISLALILGLITEISVTLDHYRCHMKSS